MSKEYEVSIVTPYHNIDLDIFMNGFESIKNQTLGFEKIEWIIVLHNCEEQYITGVRNMAEGYENVKTYILNNDVHSASSPRNFGMEVATAKYIGFLDGDDSFTPWCLKTVLKHMKKSGAQLTWFRREYELESEKSVPVTEIVLWDQTREEIIIEKDVNWDDEKMFSAVWGLVTSRMYDLEFLRENNIKYDESVKLGEDYLFNFEVYGIAEKFCYLPQTIGYHYYINSGSIIQKSEKNEEELIEMAEGLKKIYDCGLKYGFYMDATIGGVTFVLARFMMGSKLLTLEGRRKIKEIVGPYVEMIKGLKPSKIYTEKAAYDRSTFLKDYILNPEKWADGGDETFITRGAGEVEPPIDQKVLNEILEQNAGTDMGKRYDFRSINSLQGYRSKMPVTHYDFYEPLIALNTRIGESGIFVSEPITNYVYYTGTYGDKKILPITSSHLKEYVKIFDKVFSDNNTFILYENVATPFKFNDNSYLGSIYGAIVNEYYRARVNGKVGKNARFTTPDSLNYCREFFDYKYVKCLLALYDDSLTQICAPSMRSVLAMLDFILKNVENLIEDIANGTISNLDRIKVDNAQNILGLIRKNPQRAEYLKEVFSKEFTLKDIWPDLRRIIGDKTGDYKIAYRMIKKLSGGVTIENGPLVMPEMLLGNSIGDSDLFEMNIEGAFYEFELISDCNSGDRKMLFYNELKPGEIYRVYVTNRSGLYRYDTKTTIKIVDLKDEKPVFELYNSYRMCTCLEGVNFHLNHLNDGLLELADFFEIQMFDYCSYEKDERLIVLMEMRYSELERLNRNALMDKLDEIFKNIIPGYREARTEGRLMMPVIKFIEPETMFLFMETKAKRLGVIVDTIPMPHFVTNPRDIKFLEMAII